MRLPVMLVSITVWAFWDRTQTSSYTTGLFWALFDFNDTPAADCLILQYLLVTVKLLKLMINSAALFIDN